MELFYVKSFSAKNLKLFQYIYNTFELFMNFLIKIIKILNKFINFKLILFIFYFLNSYTI